MAALQRVCIDNTLFLPSFPISDMSDLELERAAMAPRRWIELSVAFQKQHSNEYSEMLHPRTTRIIKELEVDSLRYFIVPGGRYLVTMGKGICVWDLGYVSTVDCKLVASVGLMVRGWLCSVQTTPDGMGLVILSTNRYAQIHIMNIFNLSFSFGDFSIFEIYPQDKIPLLTQIARLDRYPSEYPEHLLPDTLICRVVHQERIVFRVVDYRTNYSTCFSADVDVEEINYVKVFFVLFKMLKVASNFSLGRHSQRRQLLLSSLKMEY